MRRQVRMRIQQYHQQQQQRDELSRSWTGCAVPLVLVYDDAVCLLLFACEAFLWRGVWNLNATFMIADPRLGGWLNHAVGSLILFALQLFSYVGICGCARDQDTPTDEGNPAANHSTRTQRDPCPSTVLGLIGRWHMWSWSGFWCTWSWVRSANNTGHDHSRQYFVWSCIRKAQHVHDVLILTVKCLDFCFIYDDWRHHEWYKMDQRQPLNHKYISLILVLDHLVMIASCLWIFRPETI